MSKIIAVIGATGAQGLPTVRHLLAPSKTGAPSPWRVRALTRDINHGRAKELRSLGAELVQGSFEDPHTVHNLFRGGVHGAFVNTDGFTVGSARELSAAFEIMEAAKYNKIRHFVWSNLDYSLRLGGYNPMYTADHYNGKGRFAHYLEAQPNPRHDADGMKWTVFTNGPYMDLLVLLLAPKILPDGTRVFSAPFGPEGRIPLIALDDLGWWSRYIFDNPHETTGKDLKVASHVASIPDIVEAFKRVTGLPAVFRPLSEDDYFREMMPHRNAPVSVEVPTGKTMEENFRAFFRMWRDGIVKRDMDWVRSVHQPTTLDQWMRRMRYDGTPEPSLLKTMEERVRMGMR